MRLCLYAKALQSSFTLAITFAFVADVKIESLSTNAKVYIIVSISLSVIVVLINGVSSLIKVRVRTSSVTESDVKLADNVRSSIPISALISVPRAMASLSRSTSEDTDIKHSGPSIETFNVVNAIQARNDTTEHDGSRRSEIRRSSISDQVFMLVGSLLGIPTIVAHPPSNEEQASSDTVGTGSIEILVASANTISENNWKNPMH